jgi:hypothetical protein
MKTQLKWVHQMAFRAEAGNNNLVHIDAKPPLGKENGMNPKELLLISLSSCTAMDIIALLIDILTCLKADDSFYANAVEVVLASLTQPLLASPQALPRCPRVKILSAAL